MKSPPTPAPPPNPRPRSSVAPDLEARFERAMARFQPFETQPRIAVACSGGGDSLALLALTTAWCRARGGQAVALVCEHGVSPNSDEKSCAICARLAEQFSLSVKRLRPRMPLRDMQGNLQQTMRRFRLSAFEHWCKAQGILHLALGHTEDDQAETLLLRLTRGSGLGGLKAMRECRHAENIRLLRPLLSVSRSDLRLWLQSRRLDWYEDPSNALPVFARNRMRAFLQAEGLDSARLSRTCSHLQRADKAFCEREELFYAHNTTFYPEGYAALETHPFLALSDECAMRILSHLAHLSGGTNVRFDQLSRQIAQLRRALSESPPFAISLGRSLLHRPRIDKTREQQFFISRASYAIAPLTLSCRQQGEEDFWDGRFRVLALPPAAFSGYTAKLSALGRQGLEQLRATKAAAFPLSAELSLQLARLPSRVRPVLPSFWSGGSVCALPTLNFFARGFEALRFTRLRWSPYAQEKNICVTCEDSIPTPYHARDKGEGQGRRRALL